MRPLQNTTGKRSYQHVRTLTYCALMTALLCILSPISVPIGPIPVSLGLLGVPLAGVLLGPIYGTVSVLIYLLTGIIGLPVFAGGNAGFQVLLGPTGGYAWSYPLYAAVSGLLSQFAMRASQKWMQITLTTFCQFPGILICYFFGTLQYCLYAGVPVAAALSACVIPFIPFDIAKGIVAAMLGVLVRQRIRLPSYKIGLSAHRTK